MDHQNLHSVPRHPMAVAARRTGLSAHVIRVWERRYGAVVPVRSEGGIRLYSDADLRRLDLLRRATSAGRAIGQVAGLSDGALLGLVREDEDPDRPPSALGGRRPAPPPADERVVDACMEAVRRLDGGTLHDLLSRALVVATPLDFVRRTAVPLLERVGELWEAGEVSPVHEHIVSVHVRQALGGVLGALRPEAGAPVLIASTPGGERHEFGALLVGIVGAARGWRAVYLGPDLPAGDVAAATAATAAAAVAFSVVNECAGEALAGYLVRVREALPPGVPVLVGGRGAGPHAAAVREAGALLIADLDGLDRTLATLASAPRARPPSRVPAAAG
jgi:MerR family transcriptional regulator, light-induced transcriptional regulator